MPRLVEYASKQGSGDGQSLRVEQCGLVFDMYDVSVLVENLETVSEALGMWSLVAMDVIGPMLQAWATAFDAALEVVAMTVAGKMQVMCAHSRFEQYRRGSGAMESGDAAACVVEATARGAPPSTFAGFVPEGEIIYLYNTCVEVVDKRAAACFASVVARVRSRSSPMAGVRKAILALLDAIAEADHGVSLRWS